MMNVSAVGRPRKFKKSLLLALFFMTYAIPHSSWATSCQDLFTGDLISKPVEELAKFILDLKDPRIMAQPALETSLRAQVDQNFKILAAQIGAAHLKHLLAEAAAKLKAERNGGSGPEKKANEQKRPRTGPVLPAPIVKLSEPREVWKLKLKEIPVKGKKAGKDSVKSIRHAEVSNDRKWAVISLHSGATVVRDLHSEKDYVIAAHDGLQRVPSFSPDSQRLVVTDANGSTSLFDLTRPDPSEKPSVVTSAVRPDTMPVQIVWSNDGHRIYLVDKFSVDEVNLLDRSRTTIVSDATESLISADSRYIQTARVVQHALHGQPPKLHAVILDVQTGHLHESTAELPHLRPIAIRHNVALYRVQNGYVLTGLKANMVSHFPGKTGVARISADGQWVAVTDQENKKLTLFDSNGAPVTDWTGFISDVQFTPNGRFMYANQWFSNSNQGRLMELNLETLHETAREHQHGGSDIQLDPSGQTLTLLQPGFKIFDRVPGTSFMMTSEGLQGATTELTHDASQQAWSRLGEKGHLAYLAEPGQDGHLLALSSGDKKAIGKKNSIAVFSAGDDFVFLNEGAKIKLFDLR